MKKCYSCKEVKPFTEFSRNKSKPDGYGSQCKVCAKEYNRRYRERTKEKWQEYSRNYYIKNKDYLNKKDKEYRERNKERINTRNREYYQKNRDDILPKQRKYFKNYRLGNKPKLAAKEAKRRFQKEQATPKWVELVEIEKLYTEARKLGDSTDQEWHVDHIVPLKHKKVCGLHCLANLQLLPASENISKGNRFKV